MFGSSPDRGTLFALRVLGDAVAHFPAQVEAGTVLLEHIDNAQALLVVVKPVRDEPFQHALARVPERRVPEVMPEGDGFGQLLVEPEHLRDGARNLRHLERVGQSRAVVIALWREEHLGLVLEPAKGL